MKVLFFPRYNLYAEGFFYLRSCMDNIYYVYAHSQKNNNDRIFYIGKGKGKRLNSKQGRNQYWKNIVAKYGYEAYKLEENLTEEQAFTAEKQYITLLKGLGYSLANMTDGGEGGINPSLETKIKMGNSRRGKRHNKETKEKISLANSKRVWTQESKDKVRNSLRAYNRDLSVVRGKPIICHQNNIIYNSIASAARALLLSRVCIRRVLQGKRKHTGNLTFSYA
jgi:dGTP triphosphohydrolase